MNWTRKEYMLVIIVAILCMGLLNIGSHYIIISYLDFSIYNPKYSLEQNRFKKVFQKGRIHPFYGINFAEYQGFQSKVSTEKNFMRVSPTESKRQISIIVLGGSVASHLSRATDSIDRNFILSERLNSFFMTDRFKVYNAAFSGGKQPQQYFKLLYMDLIGFEPDLIINYDGFNELALTLEENKQRKINAIFPVSFDRSIISSSYNGSCFSLNNWFLSHNTYIPIIELVKWIYVKRCHNLSTGSETDIELTPKSLFLKENQTYIERAYLIWSESSNRIAKFAESKNIPYIHLLQPCLYLPNSKPLSSIEIRDFSDGGPYKAIIEKHYKSLKMENLDTKNKIDHRYLFSSEDRTVYSDNWCHLNTLGIELIVEDLIKNSSQIFYDLLDK
tara:strand:+ start:4668 stop:5831 length:1164 start_codon:yes stop_codon:yes gene_type:complete